MDKKNLTDTCNTHRGKCCNKGKWKCTPNLLLTKSLNRPEPCTRHHVPKMNSAADGMLADPIFVYCGTWWRDKVKIEAAIIFFSHSYVRMFSVSCVGFRFQCHGWIAQNSERKQGASRKPTDHFSVTSGLHKTQRKQGASHKPTDHFCVTSGLHKTQKKQGASHRQAY